MKGTLSFRPAVVTSGEKKYYLANLPATTDLRTLAATIKARWICEQAHQQLKEELGLDHFEGRSMGILVVAVEE
jgi:SRSO17 transposase